MTQTETSVLLNAAGFEEVGRAGSRRHIFRRRIALIEPSQALLHARDYPIFGTWIMDGWQEMGIAPGR